MCLCACPKKLLFFLANQPIVHSRGVSRGRFVAVAVAVDMAVAVPVAVAVAVAMVVRVR